MNLNEVKKIIEKSLIKEVGDLKGVEFYDFEEKSQGYYEFNTPYGLVDVKFIIFNPSEWADFKVNHNQFDYSKPIYDISYSIDGNVSQIEKTNYKELLKIIGTVTQIVKDFIKKKNPYALLLFGIDKKGNFTSDKQKNTLYLMLASKNKPQGYRVNSSTITDPDIVLDGYILFKN